MKLLRATRFVVHLSCTELDCAHSDSNMRCLFKSTLYLTTDDTFVVGTFENQHIEYPQVLTVFWKLIGEDRGDEAI